jgi:hypothetical protein
MLGRPNEVLDPDNALHAPRESAGAISGATVGRKPRSVRWRTVLVGDRSSIRYPPATLSPLFRGHTRPQADRLARTHSRSAVTARCGFLALGTLPDVENVALAAS